MRIALLALLALLAEISAAELPRIVFIAGEYEYHSKETLPPFASALAKRYAVKTVMLERPNDPKEQTIPGLEAIEQADLLVLFVRRMTLPDEQLAQIKKYVESGRPVIGLRTASHAFENWKEFDKEVLGGNYHNHYGNKLKTSVSVVADKREHSLLKGVNEFVSEGSLYKNAPLQSGTMPILRGKVEGFPEEPIAWTHSYKGARVFYTSLGHPNDFKEESFRNLLHNAIAWTLDQPLQKRSE
jgi:type 1 glutamine amidotransferase